MRKLIVSTFLTLDGVMQAPGGPEEDPEEDFAFGGWSFPFWDDHLDRFMGASMGEPFDLLLGRKTYDIFAAYWPNVPDEDGAKPLNDATKYVASRGRPDLTWQESVLLQGDVAQEVKRLKQEDGRELQVHGSGNLAQTLMRHNLVDEYRLMVFPVILGSGKRLFANGTMPTSLRLVSSDVSSTGVFIGTYEPAGEVTTGSFAQA
jgi:dihydrofolate reductase